MRKKYLLFFALFLCVACDSGDIEEHVASSANKGRIVKLTATLSGVAAWESGFAVSLAGFTAGDNYAQVVRTLPVTTPDNTEVELVLSNLDAGINTAELAITNRLRERIITLASINLDDYPETSDTIRMNVGSIDVAPFSSLQRGLFNVACIQCHGGNGRSAAGLMLTEGQAYGQLVDAPSTRIEGMMRVAGGDAQASLLSQILNEGGEAILHYNHTEVLSSQFKENQEGLRSLIDEWINSIRD